MRQDKNKSKYGTGKSRSYSIPIRAVTTEHSDKTSNYDHDKSVDWSVPTDHWRALDTARLEYWKAVVSGNLFRIDSTLKAWAKLLHVSKNRVTNGN